MAKGFAPIRAVAFSFVVLAACGALGQQRQLAGSLPDAPSMQAPGNIDRDVRFGDFLSYSLLSFSDGRGQNSSSDFFTKYLSAGSAKRGMNYRPANSGSLVGRATFAASRTVITRDDSGKGRLNTAYLLRVLSAAAVHTASVPYWRRSVSAPFSDFGSTIGSDAGMNVLHEFQPGIENLLKGHTPKFISAIEQRIGQK